MKISEISSDNGIKYRSILGDFSEKVILLKFSS